MAQLLAPRRHDLGHDAREVGIHDTAEEIAPAALADEVENGDVQTMHDGPLQGDCERAIEPETLGSEKRKPARRSDSPSHPPANNQAAAAP
jgi:hypothetical protein